VEVGNVAGTKVEAANVGLGIVTKGFAIVFGWFVVVESRLSMITVLWSG
jgi:hypothetical protein